MYFGLQVVTVKKILCGIDWTIITKKIRKLTEMRTWMGNMGGCGVAVYYHERTYCQIMIMTVHCRIATTALQTKLSLEVYTTLS